TASAQSAGSTTTADPQAGAGAAGAEAGESARTAPEAAEPQRRPARRSRRATTRPADAASPEPADGTGASAGSSPEPAARSTDEPGADAPDRTADDADAAPKRRRAPRKTARKQVGQDAPGTPEDQGTAPADAPVDASTAGPVVAQADESAAAGGAPATGRGSARGRRGGRAAATSTTAQDEGASAPSTPSTGDEQPADAPVLDVLAELGQPRPVTTTGGAAPRLAATALLFQAPDPAGRSRRRRAQAPAGPPVAADEASDEAAVPALEEEAPAVVDDTALRAEDAVLPVDAEHDEAEDAEDTEDTEGAEDAEAADDGSERDEDESSEAGRRRRRRRGGRGRRSRADATDDEAGETPSAQDEPAEDVDAESDAVAGDDTDEGGSSRRRRRRRRSSRGGDVEPEAEPRRARSRTASDEVTALKGSTRLEAKRQRRREGRDAGRRRTVITEAEFLARREAVDRAMVVRESHGRVQIAVLEDGVLVEHFVSRTGSGGSSSTMVGNVYLGRVQNVLPSMEAAFVDLGKGRNAVLYAGEVNWDAAGLEGQPRRIEQALRSGDSVLVQVTKDPIGHKGARLTSQITLAGRYLVYVPGGGMTGISRKLPDTERARLKKLLKEIVPDDAGVIVRTAAEGASDEELRRDVQRLQEQWAAIEKRSRTASAPALLQGEPDMAIRVVRDIFNDDFRSLVVQGDDVHRMIDDYVTSMAPDLADRVSRYTGTGDVFAAHRVDEQLAKGMDRKVWLPSGGSLVIDRTEAMTVIDVNTGKFTGAGGTLEETVTRNNLEAAEEIVRQLRLRDIGGIIVIDFIDMVLESNRDLVLRRLVECLGRDRTKHQVAEVTSLGLVQMTRKRVGQGLVEAFSETCEHCNGRGFVVHADPVERSNGGSEGGSSEQQQPAGESKRSRRKKAAATTPAAAPVAVPVLPEAREAVKATLATIAAAAAHAHDHAGDHGSVGHEAEHEQVRVSDGVPDTSSSELEALARAVAEKAAADHAVDHEEPAGAVEPADHRDTVEGTGTVDTGDPAAAELRDAVGSVAAVEAPAPGGPVEDAPASDDGASEQAETAI
ncbi:Rne/Rng family ribonuclease, partial [Actinotalea sp. AC32]|nr:Rne/Rng family ribonuclease [Actinotalea sp. AC32]